jgi:hypothetical protein
MPSEADVALAAAIPKRRTERRHFGFVAGRSAISL